MKFEAYLDTRDLATLAEEAVAVGQAVVDGDENVSDKEISDANRTLRSMSNAFKSLGYQNVPAEDYADMWGTIGDTVGVTLVREDTIGEYWSEAALDFGRLRADQHEEFAPVIDWTMYAQNQGGTIVNFALPDDYGLNATPVNYYIF